MAQLFLYRPATTVEEGPGLELLVNPGHSLTSDSICTENSAELGRGQDVPHQISLQTSQTGAEIILCEGEHPPPRQRH